MLSNIQLHATVKRLLVTLSPLLLVILLACQRIVTQVPTPVAIPPMKGWTPLPAATPVPTASPALSRGPERSEAAAEGTATDWLEGGTLLTPENYLAPASTIPPTTSPTANPVRQNEATPSPMLPGPARASSTATPTAVRNPQSEIRNPKFEEAYVLRVVDGDTIEVELVLSKAEGLDGRRYKVRYIGVDTPETKHPAKPIECFGHEATEKNRELVEGKTVYLEKDVSETDRYGRLLRYVHLADGTFVNAELVRLGYAQVATYPPDVKYVDLFLRLQRQARQAGQGLWSQCQP